MDQKITGVEDVKRILSEKATENHLSSEKGENKLMVQDPTDGSFAGITVDETGDDRYLVTAPDDFGGPKLYSFTGTESIQQKPEYEKDLARGILRMTNFESEGYEVETLGDGFYRLES